MKKHHKVSVNQDQSGMAAIIVTMIIMLVLSIIVLGYARVANREQRQIADRQLSTQALYAAESGVNEAVRQLKAGTAVYSDTCAGGISGEVAAGSGVSYSCVLVAAPDSIELSNVPTENDMVIPINRSGPGAVGGIEIGWESTDGGTNISNCLSPTIYRRDVVATCRIGTLRIDITPTAGSLSRAALASGAKTFFIKPNSSAVGGFSMGGDQVQNGAGVCGSANATNRYCAVSIGGMGAGEYHIRIRSLYRPSKVTICSPNCSAKDTLEGAQAIIDSTGRAADVLRRIQVRVAINDLTGRIFPSNAIESAASICKRSGIIRSPAKVVPDGFSAGSSPECWYTP